MLVTVPLPTLARPRPRRPDPRPPGRNRPVADSIWWLVAAAAAFTAAQLLFVSPRLGLSWDEVVYVSQVSGHAPAAFFDPARARGIPLLVAPVTLVTSSVIALRVYLSIASGAGLFAALLAWRGLRPAWQLALAGVIFGGLWVAQYYGPQAMPDIWVAFSALAAAGLFLRAAGRWQQPNAQQPNAQQPNAQQPNAQQPNAQQPNAQPGAARPRAALAGLAGCLAAAALIRPGDAVFLAAALVIAAVVVPGWRHWQLPAAVGAGLVAGGAEWLAEAWLRFGGPLARLRAAGAEQGGFGLHLGVWDQLRALNGPTLCRPCTVGLRYPVISLWWLALPLLVALGALAAHRAGRLRSCLLAAGCALAVAAQYLFLIGYAAPRFLLPAYALLAIPVADALAWLVTGIRPASRPAAVALGAIALILQLAVQHAVLEHEVTGTVVFHDDYVRIVADLRQLGIRPPCLIKGQQDIPIAYYAGCASAPGVRPWIRAHGPARLAVLEYPKVRPPGYARSWQPHHLPGTRILRLVGYLAAR
jgi:hypothetical protein